MSTRRRTSVRALLVTPDHELLLLDVTLDDGQHIWAPPGGGVEGSESLSEALGRELSEEIGLTAPPVARPVWMRKHTFRLRGEWITQVEHYFFVPTKAFVPFIDGNPDLLERQDTIGHRWWTMNELAVSKETFAPRALHTHMRQLLEQVPREPIWVGI